MSEQRSVALIFGGQSPEHAISCLTAASVVKAIDQSRYQVHGVAIDADGGWHRIDLDQIAKLAKVERQLPQVPSGLPAATLLRTAHGVQLVSIVDSQLADPLDVDVALSLLHGSYGEDGTIQGLFEMLGLRYVGSSVAASAIGMDKQFMKQACAAAGLPVGPYAVVTDADWQQDAASACARVAEQLRFPLFVKPARAGSSIGISRVTDPSQLRTAIEAAREHDSKVVIEQGFSDFREIECAVLGGPDGQPRTSLPGEIVVNTDDHFYNFETKYLPENQVELQVPAKLADEIIQQVQKLAAEVFKAVGAEGLSRVDFFVFDNPSDGPQVIVNEINTMPGFTPLSMFPSMWQATGIAYPDLISDLIEQALARPLSVNR